MGELLIGVLVYPIRRRTWFGEQYSFFVALNRAAEAEGAQLAFFEPADIDWKGRRIHGYRIVGKRVVRAWFRFPDVIYDRFFPHFYNKRPSYHGTVRRLQRAGIPFLNAYLGGKLRVHDELATDAELRALLPETKPLASPAAVAEMVERYGGAFLKPVNGTQGAGIIRVDRAGERFRCAGRIGYAKFGPLLLAKHDLYEFIASVVARRPYLVQQPIALRTKDDRVMDIRAVVQKGHGPSWCVTGMAWRVGAPGEITSNLHTGGRAEPVEEPLKSRVSELALKIAKTLDQRLGPFGELGLDFGVDTSDRIWFIEANGRLGRMIFSQLGDKEGRLQSHVRPILYARWIKEHEPTLRAHVGERPLGYRA